MIDIKLFKKEPSKINTQATSIRNGTGNRLPLNKNNHSIRKHYISTIANTSASATKVKQQANKCPAAAQLVHSAVHPHLICELEIGQRLY